jgi:hypothetical protein
MKKIYPALLILLCMACSKRTTAPLTQTAVADTITAVNDTAGFDTAYNNTSDTLSRETRLRYNDFTVVLHDFDGYAGMMFERGNSYPYYSDDEAENRSHAQALLNVDERENEGYLKTLVVLKDTVSLYESFGDHGYDDNRINNTLLQIVPQNSGDTFKVSFCYLSRLSEIIDSRKYSGEELDALYEQAEARHIDEQTPYVQVRDSAGLYFRALPHMPDMEAVKVINGKITPVKRANTRKQVNEEERQWEREYKRIKKKYSLNDTLVVIPGEYDTVATLTKDKKLYGYEYETFLFRIERFSNGKKAGAKYIAVTILYGC